MRSSRWSSRGRSARSAVALTAALLAVYAVSLAADASPGERLTRAEAHVGMSAESVAADFDLDLRDQYRARAWRDFYGGTLRPTAAPDAGGRILEPQGVGLPLLLAGPWAVGGVTGAKLFLALLTAVAFACAAALARRLVGDPWATVAALVVGLSPPAVAAATTMRPEVPAAAALAGAAVLALRVREDPRAVTAFWAALLLATVPWMGLTAVLPAAVLAVALARWLRRRQRGLSGFVALEVILTSAVVFITVNDRLYGGLTAYAARNRTAEVVGLHHPLDVLDRLARLPDLVGELLIWAPFSALALVGVWLLWRSRRQRLATIAPERVDVEVVAALLAVVVAAQVAEAVFLAPTIHGPWFDTRFLVPVLPFAAALAAWGLRRVPRIGALLGVLTVALSVWMLVATVGGNATLRPPRGIF